MPGLPSSPTKRARLLRTQFLLRISVKAVEHWDRLTEEEQARYRLLARQAGYSRAPLSKAERHELKALLRKLEPRKLMREAVALGSRTIASRDPEPR